jgi:peptidoglycan/xylan/chitin deacetylase (PgdA/CDA1 family)
VFSNLEEKPEFSLSLNDLKEMDSKLFHFGLHGHQHHRYSMLTHDEQKEDIEKNIGVLKSFTNYIPYWAIPFGTNKDWNRDTIKIAIEKELLVFLHTNGINFEWNGLYLNRIPSDGRDFSRLISSFKI